MPQHSLVSPPVRARGMLHDPMSASRAERDADTAQQGSKPEVSRLDPASAYAAAAQLVPSSPGAALDRSVRQTMGERFGYDFSRVRVHSDSVAADLAASLSARAFTIGDRIVFGRNEYAPGSATGQALLAHELTHVVQQASAGVTALQLQALSKPAPTPATTTDPEAVLGKRLSTDFPSGIAAAFYAPMPDANEEAQKAAQKWASRESALGIRGKAVTAANARFGEAMSDADHPLTSTLQALSTLLNTAVAKAPPAPGGPMPPGVGPSTVRTLAVFAHGTTDWCGLGSITSSKAASIIKSIAPTLAPDVRVILYSCNAGRDPDASEDWVAGTMRAGGSKSLAAVTRDALIAEGKSGSVWGHTTTGHVTENFALREFDADFGKGTAGESFVTRYVFTGGDKVTATTELLDGVIGQGYQLTSPKANASADEVVENEMYRCYAAANKDLTFKGGKLAESAPVHPVDIGKQIKEYWSSTYWPAHKGAAITALRISLVVSKRAKKATTPASP
jgi:hypothetical protein